MSSLSDSGLRQELDRLSSHRYANSQREGYPNRMTASDYEMEFQMQHVDKRMAEEDQSRANIVIEETRRRNAVDEEVAKQAQQPWAVPIQPAPTEPSFQVPPPNYDMSPHLWQN